MTRLTLGMLIGFMAGIWLFSLLLDGGGEEA